MREHRHGHAHISLIQLRPNLTINRPIAKLSYRAFILYENEAYYAKTNNLSNRLRFSVRVYCNNAQMTSERVKN